MFSFSNERMIPRHLEGLGDVEDCLFIVMNHRGLAVHQPPCTHDVSSKRFYDGLMAQACPGSGSCRKPLDQLTEIPASFGVPAREK
jgi:hypothetical protein